MLRTLTPREERVIKMRFGLEDGFEHTGFVPKSARALQVTRERIRQIEAAGRRCKLRHPSCSRKLKAFAEGVRMNSAPPGEMAKIVSGPRSAVGSCASRTPHLQGNLTKGRRLSLATVKSRNSFCVWAISKHRAPWSPPAPQDPGASFASSQSSISTMEAVRGEGLFGGWHQPSDPPHPCMT